MSHLQLWQRKQKIADAQIVPNAHDAARWLKSCTSWYLVDPIISWRCFIYMSSPTYFLNLVSPCHQCDTASQYFTRKKYSKLPIPCDTCSLDKGATRKAIHLRQILWCWAFLVWSLVDSFQWNQKRFHCFHVCSCGDVLNMRTPTQWKRQAVYGHESHEQKQTSYINIPETLSHSIFLSSPTSIQQNAVHCRCSCLPFSVAISATPSPDQKAPLCP